MACGYSISMFFHMRNRLRASVWASDEYLTEFSAIFRPHPLFTVGIFAINMTFFHNTNHGKWVLYPYVFPHETLIKSISLDLKRILIAFRPRPF